MVTGDVAPTAQRGSVTVEFALIAPAVVLLLAGVLVLGSHNAASTSREMHLRAAVQQLAQGMPEADVLEQLRGVAIPSAIIERTGTSVCLLAQAVVAPSAAMSWLAAVDGVGRSMCVCASILP